MGHSRRGLQRPLRGSGSGGLGQAAAQADKGESPIPVPPHPRDRGGDWEETPDREAGHAVGGNRVPAAKKG